MSALLLALVVPFGCSSSTSEDSSGSSSGPSSFSLVDTGQTNCYGSSGGTIACPGAGAAFYGQDAQYASAAMSYRNNGDGTISDLITGLMWQRDPGSKVSWASANARTSSVGRVSALTLAGYSDWRLPTIKELYSLIDFNGLNGPTGNIPFINTAYFVFYYGDESAGERLIDAQYATSTRYVSTTMNGADTAFGVNFADGRIKGYGTSMNMFARYVRGGSYGVNNFTSNGNGSVTDQATGLTWRQNDDGATRNWQDALSYCEGLTLAGSSGWRLPNAKELQGIVDYTRSPDTSGSAAIDPVFGATSFVNKNGQTDYGFYWTGTTHLDGVTPGSQGVYVAFGRALGYMNRWMDVHGAGAQRSDPKTGDPSIYPFGHGPQGDEIRIYNYVRCVRG